MKCSVFGSQNSIVGTNQSSSFIPAFYSGNYNIMSFRHFISNRDAFSEFTMVAPDLDVGNETSGKIKDLIDELSDQAEDVLKEAYEKYRGIQYEKLTGEALETGPNALDVTDVLSVPMWNKNK